MRRFVSPTPEFEEAVTEYQERHGFKSWSQALLYLAWLGLKQVTGEDPPGSSKQWGGYRKAAPGDGGE